MKFATQLSTLLMTLVGSTIAFADVAAEVEASNTEFEKAFNSGDAAGVARRYTEDAVLLPPGMPNVVGRDDIEAMWQGFMDSGAQELELKAESVDAYGEAAVETGSFSLSAPGADGDLTPMSGKYLVVWRQDGEGAWRMHQDIWNDDPVE